MSVSSSNSFFKLGNHTQLEFSDQNVVIHVISSPSEGGWEGVNSTIIELNTNLILIDLPLHFGVANEIRSFCDASGKNIHRILITHEHPDHWMGTFAFNDHDICAQPSTIDFISQNGDGILSLKKQQLPLNYLPESVYVPNCPFGEFEEYVDGIHIKWSLASQLEYQSAFYAEISELSVLVAGDMLYNNCHLFLGERLQDGQPNAVQWLSQLKNIDFTIYNSIIPGHGAVGDSDMVQSCIEYLEFIIPIITLPGMTTPVYKQNAILKFPNHKVQDMLDLSGFFLYDFQGL
jgi:glyoxylase-like metal-dependent hydrolase (beta-lactamase superfamily II)